MHDIEVKKEILAGNSEIATENREVFQGKGIYVLNLMSGPGAGKTTLLQETIKRAGERFRIAVIEGDITSTTDRDRILATGARAIQIETMGACHLDALLIHNHLHQIDLDSIDCLIIENVGNLVCPAEFDLGEDDKVMILSVTEGDDKPRKYPVMFHNARAMIVSKTDLLPFVDFNMEKAVKDARRLNFDLEVFALSAKTGDGMDKWVEWLAGRIGKCRSYTGAR
ncbi:MAG: hydrogenase nickel incorporation protein HypB [Deltaproteobacteria bacterium]|nr:hydrogenase nickel incorporation protein HypB [Deltaproteobacteria bacterium]